MGKSTGNRRIFYTTGKRLKNGKVNTGNTYTVSNYDYEISKVKEKHDNQIEELEKKKKKDIAKIKKGKEADKMSDNVEKELEKINRINKNFEQNLAKTYKSERHHIQISVTWNNVSFTLSDKWSKKFNTDKTQEVQAMLALEETLPNSETNCEIYVSTNRDIQTFDGQNKLEKNIFFSKRQS